MKPRDRKPTEVIPKREETGLDQMDCNKGGKMYSVLGYILKVYLTVIIDKL